MTASQADAYDAMLALFKAAWDGTGHPAAYPNVAFAVPTTATPWARVSIVHVPSSQPTLPLPSGGKRFRHRGLLTVQVFTPVGTGLRTGHELAKIARDAFQGKHATGGVWFREVTSAEIGDDGEWYQINVIARFEYDEAV